MDPQPIVLEGRTVRLEPLTLAHAPGLVAALTPELLQERLVLPAPVRNTTARSA